MLNGFPVRLVVPGWYATYWVKSLTMVSVLPKKFDGFWMSKAYRIPTNATAVESPTDLAKETVPINRMNVRSFFTPPDGGFRAAAHAACPLDGIAFDGGGGVRQVDVSADGGATWRESANFPASTFGGAEPELYSVRFTSKKRGWIVGSVSRRDTVVDSLVLKTTDGGTSWQRLRVPTKSELINLDFSGDKRGWIVGNSGVVLHTRDAGETWALQQSGTTATLYSVEFRGDKDGWAVGERGTIIKTRDGGETWRAVESPVRTTLLSVRFANDEEGWVVGRGGVILRTEDGGNTWVQQESRTRRNLFALFVDKDNCWAVGGDGLVLRYER
jgi:photosystem II stability/assembly factor-like uncharacterized protein